MSDLKSRLLSYRPDKANGAVLPALLALALLAGLAVQLALPPGAAVPPGLGATRAPDWRLPAVSDVRAPDLAARPSLFSPRRVVGARAEQEAQGIGTAPAPVGPLDGTFVLGSLKIGGARAVLLREAGGRVLRLRPGGSYRGWLLLRLDPEAAVFRKNGRTLRTAFGSPALAGAPGMDDTVIDSSESMRD